MPVKKTKTSIICNERYGIYYGDGYGSWPGYVQDVVPLDLPDWADSVSLTVDGEEVEL